MLALPLLIALCSQDLTPEALYKQALPSVATVVVEDKDGKKGLGTCFLSVKDGVAVTAWHVVDGAKRVMVKFADGEEAESTGIVDKDQKRDIALIRVKVAGRKLLPLSAEDPAIGSKSFTLGAPKGLDFSMSDGIISQIRSEGGSRLIQSTAPISGGNSGGPLINSKGEAVGVISFYHQDGQNLNFAISARHVRALDNTLPTTPWPDVRDTGDSLFKRGSDTGDGNSAPVLDDAQAAAKIFNMRIDLTYHLIARYELAERLTRKGREDWVIPSTMFRAVDELGKGALEAVSFRTKNEAINKCLLEAAQMYLDYRDAYKIFINTVQLGQERAPAAVVKTEMQRFDAKMPTQTPWTRDSKEWVLKHLPEAERKKRPLEVVEIVFGEGKSFKAADDLGLAFDIRSNPRMLVLQVRPDSPAEEVHIEAGAEILNADERTFNSWTEFDDFLRIRRGKEIVLRYRSAKGVVVRVKVTVPAL